jgi:hypothetical protein
VGRVRIWAAVRATGAAGDSIEVALHSGALVVDRVRRPISEADARLDLRLGFVPLDTGAAPLRVTASIAGEAPSAAVDLVVDIGEDRWTILFFDPRPSWISTFVRRGIERDPRFVVTSRVVTSRNVSTDAGRPPGALDDVGALLPFDAIVVGAPEGLRERDVAGLEAYLRRRGGTVVLLLDQRAAGAYERLVGVSEWASASNSAGLLVSSSTLDSLALRASEIVWPRTLPPGARAMAGSRLDAREPASPRHPVVWEIPVGAGRVVVSGALDAWRFRDRDGAAFERFFGDALALSASASPRPIELGVAPPVVVPGEEATITVRLRDAALSGAAGRSARASVAASLGSPAGRTPIRLWPDEAAGELTGTFRAPDSVGIYRIAVSSGGERAEAPVVVTGEVLRVSPDDSDLLASWIGARGGSVVSAARVDELRDSLERTVRPPRRPVTWHPMRSPWWLAPLALALGGEWWWRRRRGLP